MAWNQGQGLGGGGGGGAVTSVAGKTGAVTLSHLTDLSGVGTNTHAQIDAFIAAPTAAGSNKQGQYNSSGVQAGATNFLIDSATGDPVLKMQTAEPAADTDGVKLFSLRKNTNMPARMFARNATRLPITLLAAPPNRIWGLWLPGGGTTVSTQGILTNTASSGTFAAPTPASTNRTTRGLKQRMTSGTSSGTSIYMRDNTAWCCRTTGFYVEILGVNLSTWVASSRFFFGLGPASNMVNAEPSSVADIIGFGADTTDSNVQLLRNDNTGTAAKVDLGSSYALGSTPLMNFFLWCEAGGAEIFYRAERIDSGSISDVVEGSVTTDLPTSTTFRARQFWLNNGANAAAVAGDFESFYADADRV